MASNLFPLLYNGTESVILIKWRVTSDFMINQVPFILFLYQARDKDGNPTGDQQKYKVNQCGITVRRLYKNVGDTIRPDDVLLDYEPCSHSTLMKDLCAICGVNINNFDLSEKRKIAENTSVSMVHSIPELRVSKQIAEDLGRADEDRLLKARKLVLLVDLDQTIIHSTNQNVPNDNPDIHHFQLYGPNSPWYHTKFRPYMTQFLEEVSKYYELHICTFGARRYAHQICHLIDPKSKFFPKDRILSRDEFFDPRSKTGNMKSLFPCGDSMVCIIDDRVDVWNFSSNVVHVKPYLCFKTDDINAPEKNMGFKKVNISTRTNTEDPSETSDTNEEATESDTPQESDAAEKATTEEEDASGSKMETEKEETLLKPESESSVENSDPPESVPSPASSSSSKSPESDHLLEDKDDYLLYLKDILIRIHKEYYREYEEKIRLRSEGEEILIPDLKGIIPHVRKLVLHGVNIVFSGVIATNTVPESNRYYRLAQSLGAIITNDVITNGSPKTTHLIASKWGTIKVNKCIKQNEKQTSGTIRMVTPDWLISCAERWEKVDEEVFQLTKDTVYNVNDREDCKKVFIPYYDHGKSKPKHAQAMPTTSTADSSLQSEYDESKTMLDLSPLSSFSMNDLSKMGAEVDDACSEGDFNSDDSSDESDQEDNEHENNKKPKLKRPELEDDDESNDYANEGEYPQGWKNLAERKRGVKRPQDDQDDEENTFDSGDSDTNLSTSSDDDHGSTGSLDEEAAELERHFQQN